MPHSKLSILFPFQDRITYRVMPEETLHDLGLDSVIDKVTTDQKERALFRQILGSITADAAVARYRRDVFEDILHHPEIREKLMKLLEHVRFLNDYGAVRRPTDQASGLWDLMHRLDEISDYITTVDAIQSCLADTDLRSAGMLDLKAGIEAIREDSCFDDLRKDIRDLRSSTDKMKSITVGINLNDRFEAVNAGLISVNSKPFSKSNMLRAFSDAIVRKNQIKPDNEWDGDMNWHPTASGFAAVLNTMEQVAGKAIRVSNPIAAMTMSGIPADDGGRDLPRTMDGALNTLVSGIVKKLKEVLGQYATISIREISDLIPELLFYIRFAEYTEKLEKAGWTLSLPRVTEDPGCRMKARGFWNLKLTSVGDPAAVVTNDLDYAGDTGVYLLTGANRGGKTTVTQAIGQLFVLAQGGVSVPAKEFEYLPADCVFTHFPADEDKTLDLGRLGEECKRFREIYTEVTSESLLLLNETFSTTSFEEGYYIASDAVRAILKKGARTLYNTHMHKLATELDGACEFGHRVLSLTVLSEGSQRSFRIAVAPPGGSSFAKDIAEKYGVTLENLIQEG